MDLDALVYGPGWYAWQHLELPDSVMSGAAGMRSQVPRRVCEECVRVDSVQSWFDIPCLIVDIMHGTEHYERVRASHHSKRSL